MANDQQVAWSNGDESMPIKLKVKDPEAFIRLCIERGRLEVEGCADRRRWQSLARRFEKAIGREKNSLSVWCERQAS